MIPKDNKQKLFLVFHGRFPSNKAASLFVAKSCEAFAESGLDTVLIVPRRLGREKGDPHEYYKVKKDFQIVYLPVIDLKEFWLPNSVRFFVSFLSFSVTTFVHLRIHAKKNDIVYSNESLPLYLVSFFYPKTFYEMHDFPESKLFFFGMFLRRMKWVLIHNRWKVEQAKATFKINNRSILCEPNAVDLKDFDSKVTRDEARDKLQLPLDKNIVVYTGHLYGWKGANILANAAQELGSEYLVAFVGGIPEDVAHFKKLYGNCTNILIVGFRPHFEVPLWQKAADILVLPNTAKEKISNLYTSPMKLFEYAASKRPIVASRIPSITELVDDETVFFATPDDVHSLAETIKEASEKKELSEKRSAAAYVWVTEHTWGKRAKRITSFMGLHYGKKVATMI